MKVRIGIGATGQGLSSQELEAMCVSLIEHGFDSIWVSEVLSQPGMDPLVSLGWLAGRLPKLKIGTTFLVPGRNLLRLARQLSTLDQLSGGRLLLTAVPGLPRGAERHAVGVLPADRGSVMDVALPVLRSLLSGAATDVPGETGVIEDLRLDPLPVQQPLEIWLGGNLPAALERCGRLGDGWLPAMLTPAEAAAGKTRIDEVARSQGRTIDPEHFGVSIAYASEPLPLSMRDSLRARSRRPDAELLIPVGFDALRSQLETFLEVGFSKFVLRQLGTLGSFDIELGRLAAAVGELQT